MAGQSIQNVYVAGARRLMQDAYTVHDAGNRFYGDRHFDLTYKLTFLVEAETADQETITQPTAAMQDLIGRLLTDQGWGEFSNSESDRDFESRIASTSAALLALSKYRTFRGTPECEKAVAWLCKRLTEKASPATCELALGVLALAEFQSLKDRIIGYDEAVKLTKNRLAEWVRNRKGILLGTEESHHYPASSDGSRGNRYLFFLPDCLTALAFLKLGCPQRTRRYVLNVVHFFVKTIVDKGGFRSIFRNHFCTVDHLWIYRLLKEFESKEPRSLLPQPFYSWAAMPRLARFVTSLVFLVAGCIGLYFTIQSREPGQNFPIWKSVFFTVIGTVGLALFARSLWEAFRGET
jgi:hypothetical protein